VREGEAAVSPGVLLIVGALWMISAAVLQAAQPNSIDALFQVTCSCLIELSGICWWIAG
jgi:hypothetical protein